MNYRSQPHADQLLVAGSLESQVDNLWFLPIQPFNEAHHVLTLSIDVSETRMNCNLEGVEVNGRTIDVFPAVEFRLTSRATDVGDRFGVLDVGGVVPEGYRRLVDLEGAGQETFHCFTKDTEGKTCRKLAIFLWDGGQRGDDGIITGVGATHERSGREWIGGADPGTGDTDPMAIMWRYLSVVSG